MQICKEDTRTRKANNSPRRSAGCYANCFRFIITGEESFFACIASKALWWKFHHGMGGMGELMKGFGAATAQFLSENMNRCVWSIKSNDSHDGKKLLSKTQLGTMRTKPSDSNVGDKNSRGSSNNNNALQSRLCMRRTGRVPRARPCQINSEKCDGFSTHRWLDIVFRVTEKQAKNAATSYRSVFVQMKKQRSQVDKNSLPKNFQFDTEHIE